MYQDSMRVQSFLLFDTYILSSCLRSWNAPLSITLIWLFSRCLWGKKELHYPINSAIQLQLTLIRSLEWLKWHLKENERTSWLRFVTTANDKHAAFSHENQSRFLFDFMKCAVASADHLSCPACLWRCTGGYFQSSSILKALSYFRALKIFQMHYRDSTSPWLFLVYIWVSLNQGKRTVTRIRRT